MGNFNNSFKIFFFFFCIVGELSYYRKQSGRERGGRIGKGPQTGTRTRDARSTTVLYACRHLAHKAIGADI